MPKCKLHPKRKRGKYLGCNVHLCCDPAENCPMISSHDKYKKASLKKLRHCENKTKENCLVSAVYDTKQSSPHPKKFRQRKNYIDSENS